MDANINKLFVQSSIVIVFLTAVTLFIFLNNDQLKVIDEIKNSISDQTTVYEAKFQTEHVLLEAGYEIIGKLKKGVFVDILVDGIEIKAKEKINNENHSYVFSITYEIEDSFDYSIIDSKAIYKKTYLYNSQGNINKINYEKIGG